MEPERWRQIERLYHAALEKEPDERSAFVARASESEEVRREVASLLAQSSSGGPLDRPAWKPVGSATVTHPSSESPAEGRFPPGTILAGRYRVVVLLGRGGMGEVYRAADLSLGQHVALKFLPEAMTRDVTAYRRFQREVRIARQVSHPNVCRVYDIGVAHGQPYISMEYVDGETLSSLIRRIGRLPPNKALEISRKLCSGLAAAHDRGVLHRDLKPANVMIDGRGNVLIMDFGLATIGEVRGLEALEGTPAYMAPEARAGVEVTARSDIYSLGLMIYEVFTGRHPGELPPEPSAMEDVDPAVERVILRCLHPDPKKRPASVLAIAAALPGGDPLAAALALGETPSPEIVAASRETDRMRRRSATVYLTTVLVGLLSCVFLVNRVSLFSRIPSEMSPEVLAHKARETIRNLGYPNRPMDAAYGLTPHPYFQMGFLQEQPSEREKHLRAGRPTISAFWYRESPVYLVPSGSLAGSTLSAASPPIVPGMIGGLWDLQGRLISFYAVPIDEETGASAQQAADAGTTSPTSAQWSKLFAAAGLDPSHFRPLEPIWLPMSAFDHRVAWGGMFAEAPEHTIHVEGAAWRGRPVYFRIGVLIPPTKTSSTVIERQQIRNQVGFVFTCATVLMAAFLARRNAMRKRSDRRGAFRLACFFFIFLMLRWAFVAHHIPSILELFILIDALAYVLLVSSVVWVLYQALEPFIRRHWPHVLVSWSRLLAGGYRDALIGGDILVGLFVGILIVILQTGGDLINEQFGGLPWSGVHAILNFQHALINIPHTVGNLMFQATFTVASTMGMVLIFCLLRGLLRRTWLAALVWLMIGVFLTSEWTTQSLLHLGFQRIGTDLLLLLTLLRFGILSVVAAGFVTNSLLSLPLVTNMRVWYADSGAFVVASLATLAVIAFRIATSNHKTVRESPVV